MSNKSLKVLDENGVKHLWSKISMEDYPNNEVLIAALEAIDETKIDKEKIGDLTTLTTTEQGSIVGAINEVREEALSVTTPDWNQSDETASDYIANRPFFEDIASENITNTFQFGIDETLYYVIQDSSEMDMWVNGKTYYIAIDDDEPQEIVYNNGFRYNRSDGNVFYFIYNGWNLYTTDMHTPYPSTMTVSYTNTTTTLRQVDEKFIPDIIARTSDLVQSDWSTTSTSKLSYIKNKPTKLSQFTNDLPKPDWNQSNENAADFIKNKPTSLSQFTNDLPKVDWNQSDETASDYIKNRTHYAIDSSFNTISTTTVSENYGYYYCPFDYDDTLYETLIPGTYASIKLNGVTYTGIVRDIVDQWKTSNTHRLIGNAGLISSLTGEYENTGEEFVYVIYTTTSSGAIYYPAYEANIMADITPGNIILSDNSIAIGDTVSFGLQTEGELKQLDEKFIPDTIARISDIPEVPEQIQSDWNENDETSLAYVKNRTHYDGFEVITEGSINTINDSLPEATCELGETYIIEVNGSQKSFPFISAQVSNGYYVGFNFIITKNYMVEADDSDFVYIVYYLTTKPTNTMSATFNVRNNNTYPSSVRILKNKTYQLDEKFIPDTIARTEEVTSSINEINNTLNSRITLDSVILTDAVTGNLYKIQIQNGQLVSFPVESESAEEEVTTS